MCSLLALSFFIFSHCRSTPPAISHPLSTFHLHRILVQAENHRSARRSIVHPIGPRSSAAHLKGPPAPTDGLGWAHGHRLFPACLSRSGRTSCSPVASYATNKFRAWGRQSLGGSLVWSSAQRLGDLLYGAFRAGLERFAGAAVFAVGGRVRGAGVPDSCGCADPIEVVRGCPIGRFRRMKRRAPDRCVSRHGDLAPSFCSAPTILKGNFSSAPLFAFRALHPLRVSPPALAFAALAVFAAFTLPLIELLTSHSALHDCHSPHDPAVVFCVIFPPLVWPAVVTRPRFRSHQLPLGF